MAFADHIFIRSHPTAGNRDRWIMLGYAVLAIVAIAAMYFAAGGPGVSQADIASAVVLP